MKEFYETTYGFANKQGADLEAVLFGREDCAPSHGYGPTLRPYHLFHFVTRGWGVLEIERRRFEIGAGCAFLIPAERISYYEASATEPWSYAWAGFTGQRAAKFVEQIMDRVPERYVIRNLDAGKYADAIETAAELTGTSAANYFTAEKILYELFSFLAADLPALHVISDARPLASRIKYYLDTKYMEKLRIEELAGRFDIHPNHLTRVFREAYGVAPKQYLVGLKLEKAARLLLETDMPVVLIAESIGFEDQHGFSRAFKNYWGVSPTEYRNTRSHQGGITNGMENRH